MVLKEITTCRNMQEVHRLSDIFRNFSFRDEESDVIVSRSCDKLKQLVDDLSKNIIDKTIDEQEKFNSIYGILQSRQNDYNEDLLSFAPLIYTLNHVLTQSTSLSFYKLRADRALDHLSFKIDVESVKEVATLSNSIYCSFISRSGYRVSRIVCKLVFEINYFIKLELDDFTGIERLRDELNMKSLLHRRRKKVPALTEDQCSHLLDRKMSALRKAVEASNYWRTLVFKNKHSQTVVEMLVLDIFSILGMTDKATENTLFQDHIVPLLGGKALRNYLAHDDYIMSIILCDPVANIMLNAKKLIEESATNNLEKIRNVLLGWYDLNQMRKKCDADSNTLEKQSKMMSFLQEGNMEGVINVLKNGADILGRDIHSSTALHVAASGSDLEVLEFVLDQKLDIFAKNLSDQCPIHIASASGRSRNLHELLKLADDPSYASIQDNYGNTPLHIATREGHIDVVNVLLASNASATKTRSKCGVSPLDFAVMHNHINVVKRQLQYETHVDFHRSLSGFNLLHCAAEYGWTEMVKYFLSIGAYVDSLNDRNCTPLLLAALHDHDEIIKILIDRGADINQRDIKGLTALMIAVEHGFEKTTETLLLHGAGVSIPSYRGDVALHYAAHGGYDNIAHTLIAKGANVNAVTIDGFTSLIYAAQNGHVKTVAILLHYGAKDESNSAALHLAIMNGHAEVVELLIAHDCDVNHPDFLKIAIESGKIDVIELLIRNNANVLRRYEEGNTLLHFAAMRGDEAIIEVLLGKKIDVNAKNNVGISALHVATMNGNTNTVNFLIGSGADVNVKTHYINDSHGSLTPLCMAIIDGQTDIVKLLISNGARINCEVNNYTPLLAAIQSGHTDVVDLILSDNSNMLAKCINGRSALEIAVEHNKKEIVKSLLAHFPTLGEEYVSIPNIVGPIQYAVFLGFTEIVDILLSYNFSANSESADGLTLLHMAASLGHNNIVNLLIAKGAFVDAVSSDGSTPLFCSASGGHEEVARILIENCADVNVLNNEGLPIHTAAAFGHTEIIKILVENGSCPVAKDKKNRTPLQLAVLNDHFQSVKFLMQFNKENINARGNEGWTLLHMAVQSNNLDIVKFLISEGGNANLENDAGSKPIHHSAREGFIDALIFFLEMGADINERGCNGQTLLHYAVVKNQEEVVSHLLFKGADVNANDMSLNTPLHLAAQFEFMDITIRLLQNGAVYNSFNRFGRCPIDLTVSPSLQNLFISIDSLFAHVRRGDTALVEKCIRAGAPVNARNKFGATSLHYASWKGYNAIVKLLLKNNANPNATAKNALTPLHYAAKFSNFEIVRMLLSKGAIYAPLSRSGNFPFNFATDIELKKLLQLITTSFNKIKNSDTTVLNDLEQIQEVKTMKSVMKTQNDVKQSLIVFAILSDFSAVEKLKQLYQGDVSVKISKGSESFRKADYARSLEIFRSVWYTRKEIFGKYNPATLDIQYEIALTMYKQGHYHEALNLLEGISSQQEKSLGRHQADTLKTMSTIALLLYRLGRNDEALKMCEEVYQKQMEMLESCHTDILNTRFNLGLILTEIGRSSEALCIYQEIFWLYENALGPNDPNTVRVHNNIALSLLGLGKFQESLKTYEEVFEKKKLILGINHADTIRTLTSIGGVLSCMGEFHRALKTFQDVLELQKICLQPNHPDRLLTQYQIGTVLFHQHKLISAYRAYKEFFDLGKGVFGSDERVIVDCTEKMAVIISFYKRNDEELAELLEYIGTSLNNAASKGDIGTVYRLINGGININDKDDAGRTVLHFAVSYGRSEIVNLLLENGADPTQVTHKGNTALHVATDRCEENIVNTLLKHVNRDRMINFVNFKTTNSGSTSLHVAASRGNFEIVKSLLKHGAIYECVNSKGQKPIDICDDPDTTSLLKLIKKLFTASKDGDMNEIAKLEEVEPDEFFAITGARDNHELTMLQVAILNKRRNVGRKLGDLMRLFTRNK